ncbi:MAG: ATP-binding protein [Anaerolineales bacterium]|nr:ATP-binding protein [Anaerolineales bacterium]
MKQVVVLSGKGGTGKTTVTAALATLACRDTSLVMVDADVDAANLELVLKPEVQQETVFYSGLEAVIDPDSCLACGDCAEVCRFDAVLSGTPYTIDPIACEGCVACMYACPPQAITMLEAKSGRWMRSNTRCGTLFHAELFAGQENSGKLVAELRSRSRAWAQEKQAGLVLVDGPPGIGCAVIAASTGMDLALLVTEPTISGVHDLQRIFQTTRHFQIPALVVINKADLNEARSAEIRAFCEVNGTRVAAEIPFDHAVPQAMVAGGPVTDIKNSEASVILRALWSMLKGDFLQETNRQEISS